MNPHLKRLEDLEAARKAWEESEWVLNFLRTITGQESTPPTDLEILHWHQSIGPLFSVPHFEIHKTFSTEPPISPSSWFSHLFPQQAAIFGPPFVEVREAQQITPIHLNTDFMAAILGGSKRLQHQVIYFEPEMQFYFLDGLFKPTTDEKLGTLLRALLMKCCQEMPESINKLNLCVEFRSDKKIREIVNRAKSILAADHTFFGVDSEHQRTQGPELHERVARVFIQQLLEKRPGEILTLSAAYLLFTEFLKRKQIEPVKRQVFKPMFAPLIREQFDLGLRNDIVGQNQRQTAGWKNLRALDFAVIQS